MPTTRQTCQLLAFGALVGAGGCTRASAVESPATQAAAQAAKPTGTRALSTVADDVDALSGDADGLSQRAVARVLDKLGRSMEPISHAANLRIHEVAQRLASAPTNSLSHTGLFKQGLGLVLQGLVPLAPPPGREQAYRRAVQALSRSTDRLQELVPLVEQRTATVVALRAAVDAVFVARDGEPPFGEAERLDMPSVPLGPIDEELEQAREEISKLARAPGLGSAAATGRALSSLADVLAAADTGNTLEDLVANARFQAKRLGSRESIVRFGQGGWVRAGLVSLLDGLDALRHGAANQPSPWSLTARGAVLAIDEHSSLAFQRPAIQDALRATVDAFARVSEQAVVCVEPK
jgi:hypothetical protein